MTLPVPSYRQAALARDTWALSALNLYAQVTVGLALYVYGAVSTPGYLSVLLAMPLLSGLLLLTRWAVQKRKPPRTLLLLPCAACLLDAQSALFSLCALMADVMPDISLPAAALGCALLLSLGLYRLSPHALPRLSRLLMFLIVPMLLFCGICAAGHGKAGHFFPLFGYGPLSILKGTAWILGAAATACCPLFTMDPPPVKVLLIPPLLSLLGGAATAFAAAYLMPVYALSAAHTVGWRLLLFTHMTPSVPCWSVQVCAEMLLLLLSLTVSVDRAVRLLGVSLGKRAAGSRAAALLLLLLVPAAAAGIPDVQDALIRILPLRLLLYLIPLFPAAKRRPES